MVYYEKALSIYTILVGEKHPYYGRTLNNIAGAHEQLGDKKNALVTYEAAAAIYEETMNDGQFDTVTVLLNLGEMQKSTGAIDEAIATAQRAKALIAKGEMPNKDVMMVNVVFQITKIYWNEERFDDAILALNSLWDEKIFSANTSELEATAYDNLGLLYQGKEDYESASQNYQKSFDMRKRILGENDPATALTSNNIGLMKYYCDDYEGAIAQHEYTIKLHQSNDRHVEVATSYYNYGLALFGLGNKEQSLLFFEKALNIWLEDAGPEDNNVQMAQSNIAIVKESMNKGLKR